MEPLSEHQVIANLRQQEDASDEDAYEEHHVPEDEDPGER